MFPRLVYEDVTKCFGTRCVLKRLTLRIDAGEIVGFLGRNGAGKTTALQLAMGFLRMSSGRGEILGQPFSHSRAARARVGYLPDAPVFFAGSALDAVAFAARLNQGRSADLDYGRTLLRQLDLPLRGQDVRRFSRGMLQRLGLAQALVTHPDLLLLDEPASALDPAGVQRVRELLEAARSRGAAVLLSSHQLQEMERVCDRIAVLRSGSLAHVGPLHALLAEGSKAEITLRGLPPGFSLSNTEAIEVPWPSGAARVDRRFRLPIAAQQRFLEAAWGAGAELVRVERQRGSLEELLLAESEPESTDADAHRGRRNA